MLNKQKFVIEETLPTRNIPDNFLKQEDKSLKRINRIKQPQILSPIEREPTNERY